VLEAVGKGAAERAVDAIPSPSVAVPASLHASLMARLDRLGSAKEVAQIGAVIGREFSRAAGCSGAQAGNGTPNGTRPSHCIWFAIPAGRASVCELFVQTCPDPGRRLCQNGAFNPFRIEPQI
jgi:hypothetical protein